MKISTLIKLFFLVLVLIAILWIYRQWQIQHQMIQRGQEVSQCSILHQPRICDGEPCGCTGDPSNYRG